MFLFPKQSANTKLTESSVLRRVSSAYCDIKGHITNTFRTPTQYLSQLNRKVAPVWWPHFRLTESGVTVRGWQTLNFSKYFYQYSFLSFGWSGLPEDRWPWLVAIVGIRKRLSKPRSSFSTCQLASDSQPLSTVSLPEDDLSGWRGIRWRSCWLLLTSGAALATLLEQELGLEPQPRDPSPLGPATRCTRRGERWTSSGASATRTARRRRTSCWPTGRDRWVMIVPFVVCIREIGHFWNEMLGGIVVSFTALLRPPVREGWRMFDMLVLLLVVVCI